MGCNDLWYDVLRTPALLELGQRRVSAAGRLWLELLARLAQSALQHVLPRPATVRTVACQEPPLKPAFVALLSVPSSDQTLSVQFDQQAVRALVDSALSACGGPRGSGLPGSAECGILEYLILGAADRMLEVLRPTGKVVQFTRFLGPYELDADCAAPGQPRLVFELTIASQCGHVSLVGEGGWLDEAAAGLEAPPIGCQVPPRSSNGGVDLHMAVALPPPPLTRAEYEAIEAGDVLLCGVRDLTAFTPELAIVTTTGWQLSHVQWLDDSPTRISVRCGPLEPAVHPAWCPPAGGEGVVLVPLMGERSVSRAQLAGWSAGATIDFPKNSAAAVLLIVQGRRLGTGELIRLDGEVGIRVLEWSES